MPDVSDAFSLIVLAAATPARRALLRARLASLAGRVVEAADRAALARAMEEGAPLVCLDEALGEDVLDDLGDALVIVLTDALPADGGAALVARGAEDVLTWAEAEVPDRLMASVRRGQARRRAAQPFRAMVENALDIITVIDEQAVIRYESPSIEAMLGWAQNELVGERVFDYIHPDDVAAMQEVFTQGLGVPGYTAAATARFRHKDGSWRTLEAQARNRLNDPLIAGIVINSRDVTERVQAAEALQASEARFRALFEGSADAIFVEDLRGHVLDANPAACRLHGLTREELIGAHVRSLVPPELRGMLDEGFQELVSGQVHYLASWSWTADGQRVPVEIRARRFTYDDQPALVLHVRDVSERHRAEERVKVVEAFYEQVLDDLPADLSVMEPDGRIVYLNPFSVADAELRTWLIGKTGRDYCERRGLDPALAERRQRFLEQAVRERRVVRFEETIQRPGHEPRHVLRLASPVLNDDGEVTRVIGYGLDITERKQAEEALRASETLLRTVVSNSPIILFATDADGTLTFSEGRGLAALGLEPGYGVGASVFAITRGMSSVQEDVRRALSGEALSAPVQVGGRTFECRYSPLMDDEGRVSGLIGVAFDVTEMRESEAALRRSQDQLRRLALNLQSVREEERARLSREVHDVLGQSITALRMDLVWLEKRLPEDRTPWQGRIDGMKALLDEVVQTVRRIATELRPGILDDLGLVAALEWQAQEFQTRTDIACTIREAPEHVTLDRDRSTAMFRIFQETLTNVARHAQASSVDVSLRREAGVLMLVVHDDGRGIRPDELTSSASLGLLGMRERVSPWNGHVRVEGRPGHGTTVTVTLPLASSEMTGQVS